MLMGSTAAAFTRPYLTSIVESVVEWIRWYDVVSVERIIIIKLVDSFYISLEIRSVERGICPIVMLYFAVKRSFLTFKNFVGQQGYQCHHMLGHVTSSVTW